MMRLGLIIAGVLLLLVVLGQEYWRGVEVQTLALKQQSLQQWVVASGQVRNQSLARIGAEITATVANRHVREGDEVEAGDLLISLRSDDLQAQYEQAQTALMQLRNQLYPQARQAAQEASLAWQQAVREAERRAKLAEQGMLSAEQAEQAAHLARTRKTSLRRAELAEQALQPGGDEEQMLQQRLSNARANLDKTRIVAPFAGKIQTRNVEPGDQVQPGRVLLEIARRDGLEIVVAVDEKYIAPLQLGQQAVVIADAWPEHELSARISFIAPAVDESNGTLDVHLVVDDPDQRLRLGMTVSVTVFTAYKDQTLVVSRDYLQRDAEGWYVLVLDGDRARRRQVVLGLQAGTKVELLSGVKEGELLLLPEHLPKGSRRLRSRSSLAGAID
mgnify:FL=1